jgi:DNA-binding transcriptional LysR family regulator
MPGPEARLGSLEARLFAAIADGGGITAAAGRLGLQKSYVSRQLAAMERRYGVRLLHRTTRKTSLTRAGELLAAHARRAVAELDRADAALAALSQAPSGDVRVTLPHAFFRFVIAPRLAEFARAHPQVRLVVDASTQVVDLVQSAFDVAVRIGDLPRSTLVARRLAVEPLVLVAAQAYLERAGRPRRPEDLAGHQLVELGPRASPTWRLDRGGGAPVEVAVKPWLALADPSAVLDAAAAGAGIAVVPWRYARPIVAAGRLERVLPRHECGRRPVQIVYASRREQAPAVRAFVEFVVASWADA